MYVHNDTVSKCVWGVQVARTLESAVFIVHDCIQEPKHRFASKIHSCTSKTPLRSHNVKERSGVRQIILRPKAAHPVCCTTCKITSIFGAELAVQALL